MAKIEDGDLALELVLTHSVNIPGDDVPTTILRFRKPRAGDIARLGVPIKYRIGNDLLDFEIVGDKMHAMMINLAGFAGAGKTLHDLDPNDWAVIANSLAVYFLPFRSTAVEGITEAQ